MVQRLEGFHRKLYLTRYAQKSAEKLKYIVPGATVITLVKDDAKFPVREIATVKEVKDKTVIMTLQSADGKLHQIGDTFTQSIDKVDALIETEYEQTAERVAKAIASVELTPEKREAAFKKFHAAIANFELVPSGRIYTGAGDNSEVTLFNCYVAGVDKSPSKPDKGRDSRQAIFNHEEKIAEIMARGGGVGSNLDVFRPRYSPLSKTKGQSAGAIYIGNRFSGLTEFVDQGNRRGAQMLTLSIWHPDAYYTNDKSNPDFNEDFIGAKRKVGFMEGNNSSVLISDAFMKAVENDEDWDFIFPDTKHAAYDDEWDGHIENWKAKNYPVIVYRTAKAKDVWDKIIEANRTSAEPGIIYIDTVNRYHNGWYLGVINATNPCGEQPLLPKATCNLSAVNFGRMLKVVGEDQHGALYEIDWDKLRETIQTGTQFLDNVIDKSFYFDEVMEHWQKGERRLGLGGLGVADMFIALRVRYGSNEGNVIFEQLMQFLRDESYKASIELAKEKGTFPFYDKNKYLQSAFIKSLPEAIRNDIAQYGIRNLTLNTFAPTGTTGSMTPSLLDPSGSVSTGIEPHFAMKYERNSRIGKTIQYAGVASAFMAANPDVKELPAYFVGAMDLLPIEHVVVQGIAQKYIDSAISKTVNAPRGYTAEQISEVYMQLYKHGCKGGTVYVDGSRDTQILSTMDESENEEELTVVNLEHEPEERGKYDNWSCPNCNEKEFTMVEGCPLCTSCGAQACSI